MENLIGPPSTKVVDKLKNIVITYNILAIWIFFISMVLNWISGWQATSHIYDIKQYLFFGCFLAPLWEELAFRYVPITFAKNLGKQYILPAIVLSSAIFGWGHGYGTTSLLLQGTMGFLFSLLYIKNNYSYWSAAILHAAWNITCIWI